MCARQHTWRVLSKRLAAGALFGVVCLSEALAGANAQLLVIERLQGSMLEVVREADQLGYEARFKQLQLALEESYDLPFMTRVALGPTLRDPQEEQRAKRTELFTDMSVPNYVAPSG